MAALKGHLFNSCSFLLPLVLNNFPHPSFSHGNCNRLDFLQPVLTCWFRALRVLKVFIQCGQTRREAPLEVGVDVDELLGSDNGTSYGSRVCRDFVGESGCDSPSWVTTGVISG